jgi:DNA-binding NtrC family response regulator
MVKMLHILLVEDDWMTRKALADYLARKGHQVTQAKNGIEGLRILEKENIDLVITDYFMPYMDGKEFILQIKKNNPLLPVILVSGFDFTEKQGFQVIKNVLYDYLRKPINLGLLQDSIQKFQLETLYK